MGYGRDTFKIGGVIFDVENMHIKIKVFRLSFSVLLLVI